MQSTRSKFSRLSPPNSENTINSWNPCDHLEYLKTLWSLSRCWTPPTCPDAFSRNVCRNWNSCTRVGILGNFGLESWWIPRWWCNPWSCRYSRNALSRHLCRFSGRVRRRARIHRSTPSFWAGKILRKPRCLSEGVPDIFSRRLRHTRTCRQD